MKLAISIAAAAVLSALVGSAMTYAAWQHNPQGEFHDSGVIHYDSLFLVFGSWFGFVMGIASVFIIGGMLVRSWTRRGEDGIGR
jgi:hypothetical protein